MLQELLIRAAFVISGGLGIVFSIGIVCCAFVVLIGSLALMMNGFQGS